MNDAERTEILAAIRAMPIDMVPEEVAAELERGWQARPWKASLPMPSIWKITVKIKAGTGLHAASRDIATLCRETGVAVSGDFNERTLAIRPGSMMTDTSREAEQPTEPLPAAATVGEVAYALWADGRPTTQHGRTAAQTWMLPGREEEREQFHRYAQVAVEALGGHIAGQTARDDMPESWLQAFAQSGLPGWATLRAWREARATDEIRTIWERAHSLANGSSDG